MRKNSRKTDIIIIVVIILMVLGGILAAVLTQKSQQQEGTAAAANTDGGRNTIEYYNGKPLGIMTGSAFEPTTMEKFPDSEYLYFNTYSDLNTALLEKRIDGYVADGPTAKATHTENADISYIDKPLAADSYYFMFSKTEARSQTLLKQFNEMLAEMTSDGTLAKLQDIWFGDDTSLQVIDRSGLTGENGTITAGTYSGVPPFTMFKDGEFSGMTTDLIYRFARKYGYELKFEDTDINGMLSGLAAGKYDLLAAPFSKTPEREEAADFSEPFYSADICLVVREEDVGGNALSYRDYIGQRVGILTGSSFEQPTFDFLPDSKYFYFDTFSDLIVALIHNKIDCFIEDEPLLRSAVIDHPGLGYLPEILKEDKYSFCFRKDGEKAELLQKQFNEMIAELEADGTMDKLRRKWYDGDAVSATIDRSGITGENGTLNVFVNPLNVPTAMIVNGELKGYAVELMTMFCRKYGYDCKYEQANISSGLAGIASGIYDIGANNVTVTPEREESVRFSVPIYHGGIALAVRKSDITETNSNVVPEITINELNSPDRTVGVGLGSSGMLAVEKYLPEAKELMFDSIATAAEAVRTGQLDAFVFERRQLEIAVENNISGVMLLDENLGEPTDVAVGLSRVTKISGLKDSINRFIAEKKADGTLDDMYMRWVIDNNYTMPEISPAVSPEFTIVVGTSGIVEPYSFYHDNTLTGYDIEMARRFAAWLGADLKLKVIDYSGLIAASQSGDIDCIFANLNVTDERKEAIDFSDAIYSMDNGILVRAVSAQNTVSEQSWADSIALSFEKNFIREDRWKLILEGIGTTCLITVLSALFGSVLAFLICMFRRTGSRLANVISNIYVKLLQGTPIVVLLMILYYVILGKSGLEAVWVAIIGFTLNFGAYVSEIMRSGIESIDSGQREAALALGYTENQAFFRFVFPQAAVRFLPVYRGEIVSLLKSTSIVGYIAIQDLTKMSDIIRSRTYEAFFPLIATAIIYFILAWIITLILKFILKGIDKRSRKRGAEK